MTNFMLGIAAVLMIGCGVMQFVIGISILLKEIIK